MEKKYKYILLDLDGTLVYSHPGIFSCFRYALKKMRRENPTDEQLFPCVGPSLFYSFTTYFHMSEEDAVLAVKLYREEYARTGMWQNHPIQGALECLKKLCAAGYVLALATSKPLPYASKITEKHGFSVYLTEQVGPDFDGHLSTKAEVIAECLRRLGASGEACLMVGDRSYDAVGATAAGVDCALLKIGGYASEEELRSCGANYVLENFDGLQKLLKIEE